MEHDAVTVLTADLIARARAGDGDAFGALTEPHRRELQVHCYRMLGSVQDAADVLQETLLAAWQGLEGFEGRASLRTWLYRIATNRCLNARRAASRRPAAAWSVPGVEPPAPTRYGEVVWLEPYPDALLDGAFGAPTRTGGSLRGDGVDRPGLRDRAADAAATPARGGRAPRRARVSRQRRRRDARARASSRSTAPSNEPAPPCRDARRRPADRAADSSGAASDDALVAEFVRAYEAADLDALVALLTDDVFMSMPPMPFEYEGRDVVGRFCGASFDAGRRFDLVATRANGQPAFGSYLRGPTGIRHGVGLIVLTLARRPDLCDEPVREQRPGVVRPAAVAAEPLASRPPASPRAPAARSAAPGREGVTTSAVRWIVRPVGWRGVAANTAVVAVVRWTSSPTPGVGPLRSAARRRPLPSASREIERTRRSRQHQRVGEHDRIVHHRARRHEHEPPAGELVPAPRQEPRAGPGHQQRGAAEPPPAPGERQRRDDGGRRHHQPGHDRGGEVAEGRPEPEALLVAVRRRLDVHASELGGARSARRRRSLARRGRARWTPSPRRPRWRRSPPTRRAPANALR